MVFVIPKWRAPTIRDWESLLVNGGTGREPNACTQALLNVLYMVGVTEITEENFRDVWLRITLLQAVAGGFVDAPDGSPVFLTLNDVKRHIGVEVEGDAKTFAEFCTTLKSSSQGAEEESLPTVIANGGKSGLACIGVEF